MTDLPEISDEVYAAAGLALVPFGDDEDANLFEWHHCIDQPACRGATGPCPCSGMPWPSEAVRAAIAAALVASGWRPEGDVLRESGSRWLDMAADANWLKTWLSAHGLGVDAGPACVLAAVGHDFLAYSTKFGPLDPTLPLPVADESDADSAENRVEYGAVHGTCEHWGSWPTAQSLISWLSEHHPDWRPLIRVTSGAGVDDRGASA